MFRVWKNDIVLQEKKKTSLWKNKLKVGYTVNGERR